MCGRGGVPRGARGSHLGRNGRGVVADQSEVEAMAEKGGETGAWSEKKAVMESSQIGIDRPIVVGDWPGMIGGGRRR